MGVDVAMPESHVVFASLGDVDLDTSGGVEPQWRTIGLVDVGGAEFLVENIKHPEDFGVFQHASIDHWRLVVGEHDVLAVDGDKLAIDRFGGLLGLLLVHDLLLLRLLVQGGTFHANGPRTSDGGLPDVRRASANPPKAALEPTSRYSHFVPLAEIARAHSRTSSARPQPRAEPLFEIFD
jgi:hypothetical protein